MGNIPEIPEEYVTSPEKFFSSSNPHLDNLTSITLSLIATHDKDFEKLLDKYPLAAHIFTLPPPPTVTSSDITPSFLEPNTKTTLLHVACAYRNKPAMELLIQNGLPWNSVDDAGKSAGDLAFELGFDHGYEWLVGEGVRSEFVLAMLGSVDDDDETGPDADENEMSNEKYLSQKLEYSDDGAKLLDGDNNGVMMTWESPIMLNHVQQFSKIFESNDARPSVLNVGFGLGIIDRYIQQHLDPASHTIIEAHPDVYAHMLKLGWDKKPNVTILFGRWQDVIPTIETAFDVIYWDTFAEDYKAFKEFNENVPNLLNQGGIYSFFNGLGGTSQFFHDVYCKIAEADLLELGMQTKFVELDVETECKNLGIESPLKKDKTDVWTGIKRAYWNLPKYRLPICQFISYD
ncbi:hypothetical protein HK098_000113 [Nowakowskiella sp. JEL0407]|nr:hypothetical protein HK098_000113 [Nowakowskiella sp. JEL0407]